MSDSDWLKDLKTGDTVIVSGRNGETVHKVDHITPTGRIKVGTSSFNTNGSLISTDRWVSAHLVQATPERVESIRKSRTIAKALLLAHDLKKITYEQALKVIEILTGKVI